jgi:hypothetical protein
LKGYQNTPTTDSQTGMTATSAAPQENKRCADKYNIDRLLTIIGCENEVRNGR